MDRLILRLESQGRLRSKAVSLLGHGQTVTLLVHPGEPDDGTAVQQAISSLPALTSALRTTRPLTVPVPSHHVSRLPIVPRVRPQHNNRERCVPGMYGYIPGRYARARLLHLYLVRRVNLKYEITEIAFARMNYNFDVIKNCAYEKRERR